MFPSGSNPLKSQEYTMKYRGYWIRWNVKSHMFMIQCDEGRLIARAQTLDDAKREIDRDLTP